MFLSYVISDHQKWLVIHLNTAKSVFAMTLLLWYFIISEILFDGYIISNGFISVLSWVFLFIYL